MNGGKFARGPVAVLAILLLGSVSARAVEIRDRAALSALVRSITTASSPSDIDRALRGADTTASHATPGSDTSAFGVIWYDNWSPRARFWLKGVDAEELFGQVLSDRYLLETIDMDGQADLELEVRTGSTPGVEGRIHMRDAQIRWKEGDFALLGVEGAIPFRRTFLEGPSMARPEVEARNIRIDTLVWTNRPIATYMNATASYENRILRFDRMQFRAMRGEGLGSVVMDHRGQSWRLASMIKFSNVDLNRLHEILPGLPLFARVTIATLDGQVALVYKAPNLISLTGEIESVTPGVIEVSPLLREAAREFLDSRVIQFQKLAIVLGQDEKGQPEARVSLHRRTAQTLLDVFRGVPFNPVILTVRVPIVPFVRQLSATP